MRSPILPSLLLLLGACSHAAPDAVDATEPAPATGAVRITNVSVDTKGSEVLVRVRLENGTEAPIFAINSARRIVYRPEGNLLELALVEERTLPSGSSADCHYMSPAQKQLGARRAETIELRLPRVQKHLLGSSPFTVVDEPLYESKEVRVALAWSDVPLVPDREVSSKCRLEMSENVAAKQRGVASGAWKAQ
jgi:hypothetical protein